MLTEDELEKRLNRNSVEEKENNVICESQTKLKRCVNFLSGLFLIGPLFLISDKQVHKDTFSEISYTILFATSTIWLGAILGYGYIAVGEADKAALIPLFVKGISKGELFIISTSLLAPVLFSLWQDPKGADPFPSKISIGIVSVILMFISSAFFGANMASPISNKSYMLCVSVVVFILAFILRYLSTLYHKNRIANPDFRASEKSLQAQLQASRSSHG